MSSPAEQIRKSLEEKLGAPVLEVLQTAGREARRLGFRAYLVGGVVRDLHRGFGNTDIDIVIEGDGIAFARVLARRYEAKLRSYQRFGTATILFPTGFKIDVATARLEIYDRPAALPRVRPGRVEDDMHRRDFTVNAMAVDLTPPSFGEILDPFGGSADVEGKTIRVLHDRSFLDDPTRIFRAVRFEGRLGFRMDESTEALVRDALTSGILDRLEDYRFVAELDLILREEGSRRMILRLEALGVLGPVRARARGSRLLRKTLNEVESVMSPGRPKGS